MHALDEARSCKLYHLLRLIMQNKIEYLLLVYAIAGLEHPITWTRSYKELSAYIDAEFRYSKKFDVEFPHIKIQRKSTLNFHIGSGPVLRLAKIYF